LLPVQAGHEIFDKSACAADLSSRGQLAERGAQVVRTVSLTSLHETKIGRKRARLEFYSSTSGTPITLNPPST
jgi:hypothetical protein